MNRYSDSFVGYFRESNPSYSATIFGIVIEPPNTRYSSANVPNVKTKSKVCLLRKATTEHHFLAANLSRLEMIRRDVF